MEYDSSLFGLVREAPAFIVWEYQDDRWCGIAGSNSLRDALLLAKGRLVLPRGKQPEKHGSKKAG